MASARGDGPIKAWIEPDRLAFARAFPVQMLLFALSLVGCAALAYGLHPLFWGVVLFVLIRQASLEASLRELFREGTLHPAQLLPEHRLLATLVRLSSRDGIMQDAIVISRAPRRWRKAAPPWGGQRVAVVVAGEAPLLKPLSPDVAGMDQRRARCSVERIPESHWHALARALKQVGTPREGLHLVELGPEPWSAFRSNLGEQAQQEFPEHITENATSVWCASLPCIEEPAMVDKERQRAQWLGRRALRNGALFLLASILSVAGFLGFSLRFAAGVSSLPGWLSLLGLLCLFAAPLWLLQALRSLRLARALAHDAREGRVLRFGGPLSNFESLALDADLALLFRRGLLTADSSMHEELVVLPRSGQLLYAGKQWAPLGVLLSIKRVADPPREPVKLALPGEFAPERYDGTVQLARRRLTDQEGQELREHARALRRPGSGFWWVFAFVAVALGAWHGEGFRLPPTSLAVPVALFASCFAVWATLRRFRLAARIEADVEMGWVLTVDPLEGQAQLELPALGVETLLHAQLDWTVSKRPAVWRRFGGLR